MMTIHKEGLQTLSLSFILLSALYLGVKYAAPEAAIYFLILALPLYIFLISFFRKPKRTFPQTDEHTIICPADGKIVVIEEVFENEYLKTNCKMVSVFMSPLNVHINWYPNRCKVVYEKYHPGKYLAAWNPKSSIENERTTVVIETSGGLVLLRQVAGALARRIVCYAKTGSHHQGGDEMGFIKFGSRVDIYLPPDADIHVALGDVVKGCSTKIATLKKG